MDDLASVVGNTGVAHPFLLLARVLERAEPDQTIVLLVLGDGAEALVLRTTAAVGERAAHAPPRSRNSWATAGSVSYGRYLAWRGILPVEPPRRPEPARTSSSAAGRSVPWKFGFEASRAEDGTVHLPPRRRRGRAPGHGGGQGHGDHVHHRPPVVHAEPAHGVRRRRFRRWGAVAGGADRRPRPTRYGWGTGWR